MKERNREEVWRRKKREGSRKGGILSKENVNRERKEVKKKLQKKKNEREVYKENERK